jgi:hypothetical protein
MLTATTMKKLGLVILIVILCALASTSDLSAHHGVTLFDETKPVTISGFVTKLDWRNPHVSVYLNVKDDSGKVANWRVEAGSMTDLTVQGWNREKLAIGTELTITGNLARPDSGLGSRVIGSRDFTFVPRKQLLIGPSI